MNPRDEAAFAAGMQVLKQRFCRELSARMHPIASAFSPGAAVTDYAAVLDGLHKLAGAAGSLGFDRLHTLARQLEKNLQAAQRDMGQSTALWMLLEQEVRHLQTLDGSDPG